MTGTRFRTGTGFRIGTGFRGGGGFGIVEGLGTGERMHMAWSRLRSARRRQVLMAGIAAALGGGTAGGTARADTFDHAHAAWTALLRKHVVLLRGGQASQVRYAGFAADRAALGAYLQTLSGVGAAAFGGFSKARQQAFLVNAYNAFTVELILTKYPDLKSIRDLGSLLSNPWKPKWIPLLGGKVSLDDIEHAMLRKRGVPLHGRPHAQPLERAARTPRAVEDLRLVRRRFPSGPPRDRVAARVRGPARRSAGRRAGRPRAHPQREGRHRVPRLRLGAERRALNDAR